MVIGTPFTYSLSVLIDDEGDSIGVSEVSGCTSSGTCTFNQAAKTVTFSTTNSALAGTQQTVSYRINDPFNTTTTYSFRAKFVASSTAFGLAGAITDPFNVAVGSVGELSLAVDSGSTVTVN